MGKDRTAEHMGRFWDARAKEDALYFVDNQLEYRAGDVEKFFAQGERELQSVLDALDVAVTPEMTVVDVGCGVGRLSRALAARAAHVHAIDISAEMLARARELNASLGNVTWHQGDGTSLQPIPDAAADAIVSHVVFQHIPDPEITYGYIREMGRVLEPGGWAAFQVSNDPEIHRGRDRPPSRLRVLLGRAPKGQRDAAWRGSAVDLHRVRDAAAQGGCDVETIVGAGTQFCFVRLRRR